jgi:hypothetical protein
VLVRGWPRRCHELRLSPVRGEDGHYSLIDDRWYPCLLGAQTRRSYVPCPDR